MKIEYVTLRVSISQVPGELFTKLDVVRDFKFRNDPNMERIDQSLLDAEYEDFTTAMELIDGGGSYEDPIWSDVSVWHEAKIGNQKVMISEPFPCSKDGNTYFDDKRKRYIRGDIGGHAGYWIIGVSGRPWK